jgi:hypothetical protein
MNARAFRPRAIYNARGWVLGRCAHCGRLNYVEPHGMDAPCKCAPTGTWVGHENIPHQYRDISGCTMVRPWPINAGGES